MAKIEYRLFIADERYPVAPDWYVARTSYDAIKAIELYGLPNHIAFDHDLGGEDTAMIFLNEIIRQLDHERNKSSESVGVLRETI